MQADLKLDLYHLELLLKIGDKVNNSRNVAWLFTESMSFTNHQEQLFDGDDIKGLMSMLEEQVRRLAQLTMPVDESGRFRYFVVDTGFWILAKESTSRLLPN